MKNITLSAQDDTIAGLRAVAAQKNTTVNELFRAWANELTVREQKAKRAELHDALVRSFQTVRFTSERKYTRDEINARWVFLDTNVFVYAHDDADEHKTRQAQELIAGLAMEEDIAISSQVVQEFCSVVLNKIGLAVSELQCIVNDEFAKTMAHTPDIAFYQRALDLQQRYRLSFYDSLIVQAALDLGCRTLYSEDLQAGARYGTLTVINPFEA